MKFSELTPDQWAELQLYLDTAILPISGLTGSEMPFEATAALERLRDVLDLIEIPYKGRTVTYPAYHYSGSGKPDYERIGDACAKLKAIGFRYVIVVAAFQWLEGAEVPQADLLFGYKAGEELPSAEEVGQQIRHLWLAR